MKTLRYILLVVMLLVTGCDYDRFDPIEPRDEVEWVPNAELSDVRHSFAAEPPYARIWSSRDV